MTEPLMAKVPGVIYVGSRTLPFINVHQHSYQFTPDADDETVRQLLTYITSARELIFFDAHYPPPGDPGAFVFVVRSGDDWLARSGNHGWISSWIPIEQAEVERYLHLCIPCHTPPEGQLITINDPSNWRQKRQSVSTWRWNSFRRYLNKRLRGAA